MPIMQMILGELEQESKTTQKLLELLPDEKLSWRPHAKSFSLGQLALHIANVPGALGTAATQDSLEVPEFKQAEPASRSEVLDAFSSSTAKAKEMLGSIDDERAMGNFAVIKNGNVLMSLPRVAFVRSILCNHLYHHRGQLSVYLRLLDIPLPSIYGPSADENPFG